MGAAFHAQADAWNKKTIVTVDQPIQVTDTVLQPGTYVFKLAESNADRHVVQIFNSDQSQIIDTILAIPNYRLQPTGRSRFAFWETPAGTMKAMRAWFYPGDNFGQEFQYPKHVAMLRTTEAAAAVTLRAEPIVTESVVSESLVSESVKQDTPATEPARPALVQEPVREQPVEIAQNTNPPATTEVRPAEPLRETLPETLPKTTSPFSLIGLGGLVSLSLYGLLRLSRLAQGLIRPHVE